MKYPNHNRSQCTSKKEPIHGRIDSKTSKDSFRSYQTPYNRCIKEDPVTRACPRTVRRKEFILAYVLNSSQQPPCHCNVDCSCQDRSYKLASGHMQCRMHQQLYHSRSLKNNDTKVGSADLKLRPENFVDSHPFGHF